MYAHQTFAVHIFLNILPVSLSLSLLYMATCRQLCLHKGAEQSSTLHVLFVSSFGVETRAVYILKYKYISHRQGYTYIWLQWCAKQSSTLCMCVLLVSSLNLEIRAEYVHNELHLYV